MKKHYCEKMYDKPSISIWFDGEKNWRLKSTNTLGHQGLPVEHSSYFVIVACPFCGKKLPKPRKKVVPKPKPISVEMLGDYDGTVSNMVYILMGLTKKYGGDSRIHFDAGANNVEVLVTPES